MAIVFPVSTPVVAPPVAQEQAMVLPPEDTLPFKAAFMGDYEIADTLEHMNRFPEVVSNTIIDTEKERLRKLKSLTKGDAEEYKTWDDWYTAFKERAPIIQQMQDNWSNLDIEQKDFVQQGWENYLSRRVKQWYDKAGVGNHAWNLLKAFIWIDRTLDYMDATEGYSVKSWLDSSRNMRNKIERIQALPIKERLDALDAFEEELMDVHGGNALDIANTLSLLGKSGGEVSTEVAASQAIEMTVVPDTTLLVTRLGMALVSKATQPIKVARDLKNVKEAGKMLADSSTHSGGKSLGMTEEELGASMQIIKTEDIIPGSVDNAGDAALRQRLDGTFNETSHLFNVARRWLTGSNQEDFMRRQGLTEESYNTLLNKQLKIFEEQRQQYFKDNGVELEIDILELTDDGLNVVYKEAGERYGQVQKIELVRTDEGLLDLKPLNVLDEIKSPVFTLDAKLMEESQRIVNTSSRFAQIMDKAKRDIWKGLNPFAKSRVNHVLAEGDRLNKVFSKDELRAGIEVGGRKIQLKTVKELNTYYGMRHWQDNMKFFNNFVVYERKQGRGLMNVTVDGPGKQLLRLYDELGDGSVERYETREGAEGTLEALFGRSLKENEKKWITKDEGGWQITMPDSFISSLLEVKPYRTADEAQKAVGAYGKELATGTLRAYDSRTGEVITLTKKEIDDLYRKGGYILSEMGDTARVFGDEVTARFVISRTDGLKPLSPIQMKFETGYIPRLAKDVHYGVWRISKDGQFRRLTNYFNTKKEAEAFAAKRSADSKSKFTYKAEDLNNISASDLEEHIVAQYGGPFIGRRGKPVLMEESGMPPEYIKPYDAITRNLDYLSHVLNINQWRLSVEKRWFNTVDQFAKTKALTRKDILNDPNDFHSTFKLPSTDKTVRALEKHREQIKNMLRIPTTEERWWTNTLTDTARWMEDYFKIPGVKGLRDFTLGLAQSDPFSAIRTATFHPMLGMFNLSQFLIQSFSASIAWTMNPLSAPKRIAEVLALTTLRFMDTNAPGYKSLIKKLAPLTGNSAEELEFLHKAFRKSGLAEAILTNPDYNAAIKGYGMTKRGWQRLLDTGTLPYQEGERVGLQYTFAQAFANWRKVNPKAKFNDDAVEAIVKEAKRIGMDMSSANKAFYQRGILSVPTQFSKVFWEFFGNLLGKKWTNAEKAKVIASQLVLFGSSGIAAFTPEGFINGIEQLAGGGGSISRDRKEMIREGLFGYISDAMGIDAHIAYRLAFFGQDTILTELLKNGMSLRLDDMAGPFSTIAQRMGTAVNTTWHMLRNPAEYVANPTLVTKVFFDLARLSTQFTNAEKAVYLYNYGAYLSSQKTTIDRNDEWVHKEVMAFATALGFFPDDVAKAFRTQQADRILQDYTRAAKRDLKEVMVRHAFLYDIPAGSPEWQEKVAMMQAEFKVALIKNGFVTAEQQTNIYENMLRDIGKGESLADRQLMDILKRGFERNDFVTPEPVTVEND